MSERCYICRFCSKEFPIPSRRNRHERGCQSKQTLDYKCQFCHKRYAIENSLKSHIKKCSKILQDENRDDTLAARYEGENTLVQQDQLELEDNLEVPYFQDNRFRKNYLYWETPLA